MSNVDTILSLPPPCDMQDALANWPIHDRYTVSPKDWRDQIFYFLLPDRFSNGYEKKNRLLDCDLSTPTGLDRIRNLRSSGHNWKRWQISG